MSIEDVALKRDDSDIIVFDNIFSNDLAREQQLDLLFGAKEDDDIIKMVENRLFDEYGEERVFVEEEDDMLLEDDEEEKVVDISDNDSDNDNVDDDMEDAEEPEDVEMGTPKIAIDIDADNVNISASDEPVKEDGDVNVTAQVVNISPKPVDAPMTGEDLASALSTDDDSTDAPEDIPDPVTPGDNVPAPEVDQRPVNGAENNVVGEDFDETNSEPSVGDYDNDDYGVEPDEMREGAEELNTTSELEDMLNTGLEPAPAPEETSPIEEPEDPSTEVVFGDSNDMEEKSDIFGEDTGAVRPEEDTLIGDDDGSVTVGDAPEYANNGIPETDGPEHKDTSETQVGFLPKTAEELEDAMSTVDDLDIAKEAVLPEDPYEEDVENDAETSLLGIEPSITKAADLDKIFNNAEEDPYRGGKYSMDLNEEACCPECKDNEPEEDDGPENIDNNIKVPETSDDLAKELDDMSANSADAEEEEKETISGEDVHTKADSEWEDAVDAPDITSDEKLDSAKSDTTYGDNIDAGFVKEAETSDDLEDMLDDNGDDGDYFDDMPEEGCGSEGCCNKESGDIDGVSEEDYDGGNKSDDYLSAEDMDTDIDDPKNKGNDEEIVDDEDQNGKDKEDGGAIDTKDANPTIPPATGAELESFFSEVSAESEEIIPDEVEFPKDDADYDETVRSTKVAAPGNDGSDVEVGTFAEDLDMMLSEDFEDQVESISDDEVFDSVINKGLDNSPEDEEPGSIEEEIDNDALDFVESME